MLNRKGLIAALLMPLVVGMVGLVHLMDQPRFAAYRTVDVLQMTGSGACFGVSLMALVLLLKGNRE